MTNSWREPTAENVTTYMASVVVNRANDNDKVANLLSIVVQRIRGVVGRVNTLSDTETEVPPEGLQHAIVLTVFNLLVGTPNFGFLIRGADGAETGFGYNVRMAEKWLDDVKMGMSVTYPSNPSEDAPNLVRYGSEDTEVDTNAA